MLKTSPYNSAVRLQNPQALNLTKGQLVYTSACLTRLLRCFIKCCHGTAPVETGAVRKLILDGLCLHVLSSFQRTVVRTRPARPPPPVGQSP